MNSDTEIKEKEKPAAAVTQGETPVMRQMEILSKAAINMQKVLINCEPKKAPGARLNSSTMTLSAPRCDSNSFLIYAARSRS